LIWFGCPPPPFQKNIYQRRCQATSTKKLTSFRAFVSEGKGNEIFHFPEQKQKKKTTTTTSGNPFSHSENPPRRFGLPPIMGCAASTQEDDVATPAMARQRGETTTARPAAGQQRHSNTIIIGSRVANSADTVNNTQRRATNDDSDDDDNSTRRGDESPVVVSPSTGTTQQQQPLLLQQQLAKKQLSPLNGRTVCSVALVDALPRYTAPTELERAEIKSKIKQLRSHHKHHHSITASQAPPTVTTSVMDDVMSPGGVVLVAHSRPFTSLDGLPHHSTSTLAPGGGQGLSTASALPRPHRFEDDDVVAMSDDVLVDHPQHDEDTTRVVPSMLVTPPRNPQQQHRGGGDETELATTAAQQIHFSDSSPLQPFLQQQQLLGAASDAADCASPFSRASSGGARDCSICLGPISGCSVVVMACLHTFHYECAKVWLSQHDGSCPDCRTKVCVDSFSYPHEIDGDAEFAAAQQAGEDLQRRYDDNVEQHDDGAASVGRGDDAHELLHPALPTMAAIRAY
jgi:hypothetical protein